MNVTKIGILSALLAVSFLSHAARPNILLITVDDMGWSDICCYGGEIETPNIDRLAAEELRFTQFYNNAKCTTTRSSILTSLWPRRKGDLLKTNMVTFGEVMQRAGYATGLSSKWHLGHSKTTHLYKRGFQECYGLLDGACNFFQPTKPDPDYKKGEVRVFGHNVQYIHSFSEDVLVAFGTEQRAKAKCPKSIHLLYTS